MRFDYLFYVLAVVFFALTAVSIAIVTDQTQQSLWVVGTVVIGLFSAGIGIYYRPKKQIAAMQSSNSPVTDQPTGQTTAEQPVTATPDTLQMEKAKATPIAVASSSAPIMTVAKQELATSAPIASIVTEPPASPMPSELTVVKGISVKRAEQLNTLGVRTIEDLAKASPEDLAKSLAVSPRITRMWIGTAKKQKKSEN